MAAAAKPRGTSPRLRPPPSAMRVAMKASAMSDGGPKIVFAAEAV